MLLYRWVFTLLIGLVILSSCRPTTSLPATGMVIGEETAVSTPILSATPQATVTLAPTATPSPPPTATAAPTILARDLSISAEDLYLYPVPNIIDGDLVTIQVIPYVPDTVRWEDVTVHLYLNGEELANDVLVWRSIAARPEALFEWVWDTTGLAGEHEILVVLDQEGRIQIGDENPDNNQTSLTVTVGTDRALTASEVNAAWVMVENICCRVHVVTGTAAYRDLPDLLTMLDSAVQKASTQLVEPLQKKIDVYFIDRVIGQGGYAGSAIVVSYLDRQYNGQGLYETLVHETVHVIDRQFAPRRISFLAEGVAVWATGGHYKPEDLASRSAALVSMGEYIPLDLLANDFYPVQHEIGYLQAGGFVKYLVDTYGWSRFRDFYSDVTLEDALTPAAALDINLQLYYNKTLAEMEAEWLAYLQGLTWEETAVIDLATTIRYYDTMRHYQLLYDPTAHFLTAWLPYPQDVRERGNPADLSRRPRADVNIALEALLASADEALRAGEFSRANVLLDSVTRVLDNDGVFLDPLAIHYLNIVHVAAAEGYEVQSIYLSGNRAEIVVTKGSNIFLSKRTLILRGQEWVLTN
jgi:hypothetical protein